MKRLQFLAGPIAYNHIMDKGLNPSDVNAIIGASGSAKWLTIYGLDRAIFATWLKQANHQINLFGTSIGAFKLAAASRSDSAEALTMLANAYIAQDYTEGITPETIASETEKIIRVILPPEAPDEILAHPYFRFHCGVVRCKGLLARNDLKAQKMAMITAFLQSLLGMKAFRNMGERIVFTDPRSQQTMHGADGYPTRKIILTPQNMAKAILASGSIPVWMNAVKNLEESEGVFRDGGLIDYHPVPSNFWQNTDGLILYPHFYGYLKSGWFDKFFPWRNVQGDRLNNVLLVGPTEEYVQSLPGGEIPNRTHFLTFQNNSMERMRRWKLAIDRSLELGDEFLEIVHTGKIKENLRRI